MLSIAADQLEEFTTRLFVAVKLSQEEAALIAKSLVGANLRGHDSHGVMRVPSYIERVNNGESHPGVELKIINDHGSLLQADGNWGFGQTQTQRLTKLLIKKAKTLGVAIGTIIHSGHIGRLGEYCEMATQAKMVAMVMVNTHGIAKRVAPPGGTAPRLGTNPLAIGVPNGATPLIVDFGTSAIAEGKVRLKKFAGEECPPGWILDSQGTPTTDPNLLYGEPPGTILPMGGDQTYKGFALGMMVEIFSGALSGGVCATELGKNPNGNCVWMMVMNPALMGGAEHFAREVNDLFQFIRQCPKMDGVKEIVLPGDPERNMLQKRNKQGIPMEEHNWQTLVDLANTLGVDVPQIKPSS